MLSQGTSPIASIGTGSDPGWVVWLSGWFMFCSTSLKEIFLGDVLAQGEAKLLQSVNNQSSGGGGVGGALHDSCLTVTSSLLSILVGTDQSSSHLSCWSLVVLV